jgi:ferrochelatase
LDENMPGYDAFLLVSFGGPESPADVMPFLENVTRGRPVPAGRLAEVAGHYQRFGGVSPINQHCRDLLAAIEKSGALRLPLYWGNRNWHPFLADTVARMAADGVRHAIAFVTSAYGSYSSCRQYLDDIAEARARAGPKAPRIDKIGHFYRHPGFIEPFAESTLAAIAELPPAARDEARLVFTAHSIPAAMAAASGRVTASRQMRAGRQVRVSGRMRAGRQVRVSGQGRGCAGAAGGLYPAQLAEAARLVAERVRAHEGRARGWDLVYQSRSGPPSVPWLGPDVSEHLAGLARAGARGAVLVPVGFVCDHLEVLYDLDVEAAGMARDLGLAVSRAATPGTHPRFVSMICELAREPAVPCPPACCLDSS